MKLLNIPKEWLENKCHLGLQNKEIADLLQQEKGISCTPKTIGKYRKKYGIYIK